jgi:RNA polymerase sigma-70 factor (ECF subfamily)
VNIEKRNRAITKLLMQHRTALYGYIFSCVRNHTDAEDIFQETSMAAVDSFAKLRDSDAFFPWAVEIARRRVLSHIRRSQRTTIVAPELVPVLAEAAERVSAHCCLRERTDALVECLEALPDQSRDIITMRYSGRAGAVERVAEKLGRSMQGAYSLLKRIRYALRDCVERKLGTEACHEQ